MNSRINRLAVLALAASTVFLGAGCSTLDKGQAPAVSKEATWAVLPFANNTETPLAGSRAESLAASLLHTARISKVRQYPASLQQDALFEAGGRKPLDAALAWARESGARYAVTGSVDEWRYKVGVDGEPAVGMTISIVDVDNGETLWSGAGGQSGWSRESLSAVAQQLMRSLLDAGLAGKKD